MADNTLDQIVDDLRSSGSEYFPQHSEVKAVRVVGHTPKPDHYIYEIVVDFIDGSERVNAKLYRGKSGSRVPQELAGREAQNLQFAHQTSEKTKAYRRTSPGWRLRGTRGSGEHQGHWLAIAEHHYESGIAAG